MSNGVGQALSSEPARSKGPTRIGPPRRVLMLLVKDFEARARREAQWLLDAGYEVRVLCRESRRPRTGDLCPVLRVGLPPPAPAPLSRALTLPVPGNPVYTSGISWELFRYRPDVLHVHDLPLVVTGALLGAGRIPVIYDLHENYPAMVQTWRKGALQRFLSERGIYHAWDRLAFRVADHFLVVCDEQGDRLRHLGVDPDSITVVGNTPDLRVWGDAAVADSSLYPDSSVIFYSGGTNRIRGLHRVIDALPFVLARVPTARFVIAGTGDAFEELREQSVRLGVADRVHLLGWLDDAELRRQTARADVCVIPHEPCEFINTTYPNKIFEYMLWRKPLVVSDALPLARIVREGGAGLVAACRDEWVDRLVSLLVSPALRDQLAAAGAALVHDRYSAEHDRRRMLSAYQRLFPV